MLCLQLLRSNYRPVTSGERFDSKVVENKIKNYQSLLACIGSMRGSVKFP